MTFDAQLLAARPSLLRYAKKLTRGNVAAAEDLLSTATVKMLSSSAAFAPGTNFMAWASTILRNSYFDYRRRLANRIIVDDIEQLPHLAVPPEVESRQRAADMLRAFIHLPPPMRSTLMTRWPEASASWACMRAWPICCR